MEVYVIWVFFKVKFMVVVEVYCEFGWEIFVKDFDRGGYFFFVNFFIFLFFSGCF